MKKITRLAHGQVGYLEDAECSPVNDTACAKMSRYTVTQRQLGGGAACPYSDGQIIAVPCDGGTCDMPCTVEWTEWTMFVLTPS